MSKKVSEFQPLSIMISSRCMDEIEFNGKKTTLSEVRIAMKKKLESMKLARTPLFDVWIHEDESQTSASETSWEQCMREARQTDIVLVLYNGNSGWNGENKLVKDNVGICHAEFSEALNKAPNKVRCIELTNTIIAKKENDADDRFQKWFNRQGLSATQASKGEDAIIAAVRLAVAAVLSLARAGVGLNSKGQYFAGEALQWTRLDFQGRREITRNAVTEFLSRRAGHKRLNNEDSIVIFPVDNQPVAFVCDCIPSSLSTPAAREIVGQPFLRDHLIVSKLKKEVAGPVHVIACQKGVSESQAIRQLGFPDAVLVAAPFGIYVADNVQKIQMVFIAQCRDETTTRLRVQLFLQWLERQGEDKLLASRAVSRRKISDLVAGEN